LQQGYLTDYLNIIIPIGAFNVIGSLQNLESAEAAGDRYDTREAMLINGVGSLAAAIFGSCFPTTIYIGHPGWKAMGARISYSILSGIFMTVLCLSGTAGLIFWAVPLEAGMAIVLWIGIVISAQAFQATPRHHAPAVVLGIMVGLAAFGTLMVKAGIRAADTVLGGGLIWQEKAGELTRALASSDLAAMGLFSVEQGTIFSAMIFAALTVEVIERRFRKAAAWAFFGALLSGLGLVHSFLWDVKDVTLQLRPATPWMVAYAVLGVIFWIVPWVTEPVDFDAHGEGL
jgi:AGZA family xanthine/uracil permease-like MFS transporter